MHRGAWWATVHGVAESDIVNSTFSHGVYASTHMKPRETQHKKTKGEARSVQSSWHFIQEKELLPSHSPSLAEGGNFFFFFFWGSSTKPFLAESVPATSEKVPEELLSCQFHSFPQSYRRTSKPLAIILKAWKSQITELAATSISEPWILSCHPLLRDI